MGAPPDSQPSRKVAVVVDNGVFANREVFLAPNPGIGRDDCFHFQRPLLTRFPAGTCAKNPRISSHTAITSASDNVKAEGSHIARGICFALFGNRSLGIR